MPVELRLFRNAMACFASGVTVVTAVAPDARPVGVTVSAFSSLSMDPPMILVCLDHHTSALDVYQTGPFAVNILDEHQKDISIRFATRDGDRWASTAHRPGQNGCPIIDGCLASVECDVHCVYEGGDHKIIVGRVTHVAYSAGGGALAYFRSTYASLNSSV